MLLKYTLRVLRGSSFKKLAGVINKTHEKSGKNRVFIFFDMLLCALRYGAGYNDYLIFAFWDMNHKQRETYITRYVNKKLITQVNDDRYRHIFDNKDEFCERFEKYLKRDYLNMTTADYAAFCSFFRKHRTVLAKPRVGESGKGIELLCYDEHENELKTLYESLKAKNTGVLEEKIIQHPKMAELHPDSVNTLRIVTFVADGRALPVYSVCKIGNKGKFVDNMENDGLCCPIDPETGRINGVAHTAALINHERHPLTGAELIGFEVPFFKEAVQLCLEAAMEIPEFRYIGWDAAITESCPLIIEGNDYPGYDFWQLPEHTPDKIGLKPFFAKYISI